ncbi:helix-turn-helix domain-containing protein [Maribacter sp. 2304DJ31-5]|uniref:helix-turn-helix domain-containing protein n=1 Tax=Maribacter sp. 2304DJ31-5 TaxID=3386273 RepID=UPI0039BCAFF3
MIDYFKKLPTPNKLEGDNFLFLEYNCPINIEDFQLWTDSNIIVYVLSGRKDWIAPEGTYEIHKGDALFIRKGVYATKQYFERDYCVLVFFLNDKFISNFLREHKTLRKELIEKETHKYIYNINVDDGFKAIILSMFNYLTLGKRMPKALVEIKFRELLYNILLNSKNYGLVSYLSAIAGRNNADLETVMLQNFKHDLSLEEFARLSGKSLSSFKRDFKASFGETPGHWIKNKRLELAKGLLSKPHMTINEICYESGFKNPSHFNKAFKDKYRLPPQQYRLNNPMA